MGTTLSTAIADCTSATKDLAPSLNIMPKSSAETARDSAAAIAGASMRPGGELPKRLRSLPSVFIDEFRDEIVFTPSAVAFKTIQELSLNPKMEEVLSEPWLFWGTREELKGSDFITK